MSTKESILEVAVELYNLHGLTNVNSRSIAKKMGKSHGNIEYHFKNNEVILLAVYKKMTKEIAKFYVQQESLANPFEKFDLLLHELELFQVKYGFINMDLMEISRNYPTVNLLLQKTLKKRKEQMSDFFKSFVEQDLIIKNDEPNNYLRLQHTIRILITFWVNQEGILTTYDFNKSGEMSKHIWALLIPYMTPKGLNIFTDFNTQV